MKDKQSLAHMLSILPSAEGFPDKTAIAARAAQLHSLTTHHDGLRLYPNMVFSCNGLITGIKMLGYRNPAVGPEVDLGIDLELWQPSYAQLPTNDPFGDGKGSGAYPSPPFPLWPPFDDTCKPFFPWLENILDPQSRPVARETGVRDVTKFDFSRLSPVMVMEGCVLAIRQRPQNESSLSLLYQEGGGPQAYAAPSDGCLHAMNDTASGGYDYPLIALNFTSLGMLPLTHYI